MTRVALVTGASRGIGHEVARQLLVRGLDVIGTGRDPASLTQVAETLGGHGGRFLCAPLDVSDPANVDDVVNRALSEFGRIDVLVNNAGIAIDGREHRASRPDFDKVMTTLDTNLLGAWRCIAAVVPTMRAKGYGRIVNLSSHLGSLTTMDKRSPAYRISKASLNALTRILADELAESGVLVNAVSPGYTRTGMSPNATRTAQEAADTPVWLATLPNDGPTGGFFYERKPLPW